MEPPEQYALKLPPAGAVSHALVPGAPEPPRSGALQSASGVSFQRSGRGVRRPVRVRNHAGRLGGDVPRRSLAATHRDDVTPSKPFALGARVGLIDSRRPDGERSCGARPGRSDRKHRGLRAHAALGSMDRGTPRSSRGHLLLRSKRSRHSVDRGVRACRAAPDDAGGAGARRGNRRASTVRPGVCDEVRSCSRRAGLFLLAPRHTSGRRG